MKPLREVHVTLTFALDVEGDVEPGVVGQSLCQHIQTPGHIGNPDWIATPTSVAFIGAEEVAP
jgi:hypothetical protein